MDFRDVLMAAATQGGGAAASPYGPECIANGNFALAGPPPTLAGGGSISGGQFHTDGSANPRGTWTSLETLTAGDYLCSIDVIATDATDLVRASVGGTAQNFAGSDVPGTYTVTVTTAASIQTITLSTPDTTATLDNFSVKRVN